MNDTTFFFAFIAALIAIIVYRVTPPKIKREWNGADRYVAYRQRYRNADILLIWLIIISAIYGLLFK